MKKFRLTSKPRKHYKTLDGYLRAIYDNHKDEIKLKKEFINNYGSERKAFVKIMKEKLDGGKNYRKALGRIKRSSFVSDITPKEAKLFGQEYIVKKAGLFITDEKGKFAKHMNPNDFEYIATGSIHGNGYTIMRYKKKYIVSLQSPKHGHGATLMTFNSKDEALAYVATL
jgi:hypothetical protein